MTSKTTNWDTLKECSSCLKRFVGFSIYFSQEKPNHESLTILPQNASLKQFLFGKSVMLDIAGSSNNNKNFGVSYNEKYFFFFKSLFHFCRRLPWAVTTLKRKCTSHLYSTIAIQYDTLDSALFIFIFQTFNCYRKKHTIRC